MKIKITDVLPIVNPPEVGSIHTVTRRETEPPRNRRTKMYYIEVNGREIGGISKRMQSDRRVESEDK